MRAMFTLHPHVPNLQTSDSASYDFASMASFEASLLFDYPVRSLFRHRLSLMLGYPWRLMFRRPQRLSVCR